RGRVRFPVDADRGPAARDRTGLAARGRPAADHRQLSAQRTPLRVLPVCSVERRYGGAGNAWEGGRGGRGGGKERSRGGGGKGVGGVGGGGGGGGRRGTGAREEPIGRVPRARATDVDRAVAVARRAQPLWRRMPGLDKAKLLHEVAARLRAIHREVADLKTQEGGKPMIENLDEIDWTAACFDYYAELGRHSRGSVIPPSFEHQVNFTVKEPYGVVAAIVPFNYPLLLMAWKVAPALAAGNTVIIKPAHQTPLATLELARAFEVLPPGVVSIVTGLGDEAGEPLVAHPGVDLIAFTGSTATGKKILRLAAETFKKTNMETSGIDPFIVCENADLHAPRPPPLRA